MTPPDPPARIVSLVPSLTEACFALGLGDRVVGVTDWCVHPADAVASLPKLGGTKNPDVAAIAALAPDLVIANHEENTRGDVARLEEAGLRVWVTYPRTVREGARVLRELAALGAPADRTASVCDPVDAAIAEAASGDTGSRPRVFCPIWKKPWMSVGPDTYAHDLIELCGGDNAFGDRRERRYPIVKTEEVEAAQPDVVLLPDEPYAFAAADARELAALDLPAARAGRIHCIDGTLLTWYGPRIARAVRSLRALLAEPTA